MRLDFDMRMAEAEKFVAALDREDGYADRSLAMICSALEDGLRNPEHNSHFEALVMLRDLVRKEKR